MLTTEPFIHCQFVADRTEGDLRILEQAFNRGESLAGDSIYVSEYESALQKYFGVAHAIAVSSGTAALHCALAVTIKPGDEVIVPVIGVPMTVTPIIALGGVPVFVDSGSIEKGDFVPDIRDIESKLTSRTKAIITISMWGYPAINSELRAFASEKGLLLIEDTAQGAGAIGYCNKHEGTVGDIGCFSSHEFKLISTGEGGFILCNEPGLAASIRRYSKIGFDPDKGFGTFNGLNYKLGGLQALLGISQVEKVADALSRRKAKVNLWKHLLSDTPLKYFGHPGISESGYSAIFSLPNAEPGQAAHIAQQMAQAGVITDIFRYRQGYLCNFPLFASYLHKDKDENSSITNVREEFPFATAVLDAILVLPTHDSVTTEAMEKAAGIIRTLL